MNDLNTLMHASVDGARPDVDRLLAGALRDGQRLQRRRRISFAGAGVALAAIAVAAPLAAGSIGRDRVTEGVPASAGPASPTGTGPAALRAGQTFDLGHGLTGTVVACTGLKKAEPGVSPDCVLPARYAIEGSSTIPGPGTGFAVVLTGSPNAMNYLWSHDVQGSLLETYHGITYAMPADDPSIQPVYQGQAVEIHLPGWKQVGQVADDKQTVQGPGGAVATIVWRPASEHDAWVADNDKGANAYTWTSSVHEGVFVSIQAGQGVSGADIQALGASLTWK